MKEYFRDFSMAENSLVNGCSDLEEVINNRQEKFMGTAEYQDTKVEIRTALKKLLTTPGAKVIEDIEDTFLALEGICYSAAYRDGMSDLMTAMTFNQLGFTKVKYYDLSKGA